jgi:hypothetical protein
MYITNNLKYLTLKLGFTGSDCSVNINDCEEHKCQFGICIDGIGNYSCECKGIKLVVLKICL